MYPSKVNQAEIVCTEKKRKNRSGSTVPTKNSNSFVHRCNLFRHRRMTISGYGDINRYSSSKQYNNKRRRINSIALPTKFLLGGNITDPLNLKSLENENKDHLTVFTPPSSPVSLSKHKTQVKLLIPPNIYDPLNLNTGEEILFKVIASKSRRRKHRRKNHIKDDNIDCVNISQSCQTDSNELKNPSIATTSSDIKTTASINIKEKKIFYCPHRTESKPNNAKIVSPVVPQGNRRFFKRLNSKCVIRVDEVLKSNNEKRQKRPRRKIKKTEIVFKKNAEYLCYGSHIQDNKNLEIQDARFKYFDKSIFCEKTVLDVGCNVGNASIYIANYLEAKHVTAVDVDQFVIDLARKRLLKHWQTSCHKNENFPLSMSVSYGPISRLPILETGSSTFPHNVTFIQGNYVLNSDDELQHQRHEYDVILCLRVSKWIHLNWGDDGLKRSFKRMFTQLRYGGQLIFEPQPWTSYAKAKKLSATIFNNYNNIQLKPDNFIDYMMSENVGFTTCTVMGRKIQTSRGGKQPMYLLTKGFAPSEDIQQPAIISPVVYNDAEWADRVDEQDSCGDWEYSVISGDNSSSDCVLQPGASENSHFEAYSTNHTFLDDYNIFPTYEEPHDNFE